MEKLIGKSVQLSNDEKEELERYREFNKKAINNYSDIAIVLSEKGIITHTNISFKNATGFAKNEIINSSIFNIITNGELLKKKIENFKEDFVLEKKIFLKTKLEEVIPTEATVVDYLDNKYKFLLVLKDLRFSQSENLKAKKVQAIFESGDHIIWSIDSEYKLTSFNSNYSKTFKKLYNVYPKQNDNLLEIEFRNRNIKQKEIWKRKYEQVFNGDRVNFEAELTNEDGSINYRQVHLNPIIDDNNQIIEISGIALDITDQKNIELQLNKNRARYDSIFVVSPINIWSVDAELKITASNNQFNNNIKKWFNKIVTINSNFENYFLDNNLESNLKIFKNKIKEALKNKKTRFEFNFQNKKKEDIFLDVFISPIILEKGIISEISCEAIDVTENKKAERELSNSLLEKETLLKEIHHRVKNNLQIISSILNLQSTYVKDGETMSILTECQNRIRSMSFIHESLYGNRNLSEVDFSDYIKSLSANLIQSYAIDPSKIKFKAKIKGIKLSIDQAIPVGLIINEIISNSLKHAFPVEKSGEVNLQITEKDGQIEIELFDNGVGANIESKLKNNASLGLQLVMILVEQLDGKISVISEQGLKYLINFEKI